MLYYDKRDPRCIQIFKEKLGEGHIGGYWFNDFLKENKWTLYFHLSNIHFYFDDEDTLKTFLELHWQEYRK